MVYKSVDIAFPDSNHPAYPHIKAWADSKGIRVLTKPDKGDILILVSCTEIIKSHDYKHAYVIHESDLPNGRGWSPLAWQILEGKNKIVVSLIELAEKVDSGAICKQETLHLDGTELANEIHEKSALVKTSLIDWLLNQDEVKPFYQLGKATYYPRRTPADSELDIHKTIAEQFNLLRICEPRFPAFFNYGGRKYTVTLTGE